VKTIAAPGHVVKIIAMPAPMLLVVVLAVETRAAPMLLVAPSA
jgi:hypothetical protein